MSSPSQNRRNADNLCPYYELAYPCECGIETIVHIIHTWEKRERKGGKRSGFSKRKKSGKLCSPSHTLNGTAKTDISSIE
jgi:hypothetical protein